MLEEKVKSVTALDLAEVQGEGKVLDAVVDDLLHPLLTQPLSVKGL